MKIGIQLYSVREALKEDFKGTLEKLNELGFQGVEFAFSYGGMEAGELAEFLKKQDIRTIGIYERLSNICDPDAEVYRQANALECKYLTFGFSPKELEEDFCGCLDTCSKAVEIAESKGKVLCYHAHAHEFAKINGKYQLDLLLEIPGLMFEADTCWIQQGGEDVVGYMEKYADRIPLLHVKDVTAEGKITELGNGVIDFAEVVKFASKHNIPWLSYEQDTTELTALKSAEISISYIKQLRIQTSE